VSESSTTPGGSERPFDAELFARQTVNSIETGDAYASVLERRVIRLEQLVAARWPRSMFLRRQLAREIRASVATWDEEYIPRSDFYARRLEAVGLEATEILDRQARSRAHGWPEPGDETEQEQPPAEGSSDPGEGLLP
jgi:hypothetical protein